MISDKSDYSYCRIFKNVQPDKGSFCCFFFVFLYRQRRPCLHLQGWSVCWDETQDTCLSEP